MIKRIGIIGGGFCGTMLAVNLIHRAQQPLQITLAEKSARIGRGCAYGTYDPHHLLNVPADCMGAFSGDSTHFYRWLVENSSKWRKLDPCFEQLEISPQMFAPRQIYGLYLEDVWNQSLEIAKAKKIYISLNQQEVSDIREEFGKELAIRLKNGLELFVDSAVLAVGVPSNHIFDNRDGTRYIPSIWLQEANYLWKILEQNTVDSETRVIIIGSGLTMLDTFASLVERKFPGKIIVVSPHAWFPEVHQAHLNPYPQFIDVKNAPKTAVGLFKSVQKEVKKALENERDWREVIDALRPISVQLWEQLSWKERGRFVEHLLCYWNRFRHRMPPYYLEKLIEFYKRGGITMIGGFVTAVGASDEGSIKITYTAHEGGKRAELVADYVINCSGAEKDITKCPSELIQNLLKKDWIRSDPLKLGVRAAPNGAVQGTGPSHLYALGQLLFGERLETTSVPELRTQCSQLAEHLLKS